MSRFTPGEHSYVAANGLNFTYRVVAPSRKGGPSTGPEASTPADLIIIHPPAWGLGSRYLCTGLAPLAEEGADRYSGSTLLFFHPRGTDGSTLPDCDDPQDHAVMSPFTLASDLEHLRSHLGLDRFPTLLGHSNGGTIALCYAELFPSRVRNLILISHRLLSHDDLPNFLRCQRQRRGDSRFEAAYAAYARGAKGAADDAEFMRFCRAIAPLYFYSPETHLPTFLDNIGDGTLAGSARCSRWVDAGNRRTDVRQLMKLKLKDVTARTLVIFGREDAQCSVQNAWETVRELPAGAETAILPECGHIPWIEQPTATFEAIRRFLTHQRGC
ncbi:hypothetical protein VTO42DRAFT_3790 [Malbranchea cinnamomea]